PLHAFDAQKIKGGKIEVKRLPKDTPFTTLDGVERKLHEEDLMICDAEKPMCIAGVFGGEYSGVTENTSSIFLESAYFDPISVRKTAKRHGLNTDASFRFERGVDIEMSEYALKRAAVLIKEIAGGEISSEVVDLYPKKPKERQVFLTFDKINSLIGQEIPRDTIKSILTALEIKVNNVTESGLGLTIPFYRVDVEREVDVIEEILRVYGYNNIDFKEKLNASIAKTQKREPHKVQDQIANLLVGQGFYEIMTNSLVAETLQMAVNGSAKPVHMLNPLSNDMGILRTNMLVSGLETVLYNLNRQKLRGKFFEFGKTYRKNGEGYDEKMHLSLFVFGQKNPQNWNTQNAPTDFFFIKGLVEGILERNGISNYTLESVMDE
ncbi:MAG: phenylalanine--tRNA ligase subunit beta, partial [Bacteroidota bacterium]